MLEISVGKVVRVIMLFREHGPDSNHLSDYIGGMNEDEKINLVALTWVGRESFEADDFEAAKAAAGEEATALTENYLASMDNLSEYLESGLEAMGIDVTAAEDDL